VSLSHWIGGIFSHLGHISSSWWELLHPQYISDLLQ
jgi:hypothetical protein